MMRTAMISLSVIFLPSVSLLGQGGVVLAGAPAAAVPPITSKAIQDAANRLTVDYTLRADSASARAARLLNDINREGKWARWTTTIGGLGAATFGFLAQGDKGRGVVAGLSGLLVGVGSIIEKAAGTSNKQSEAEACRAIAAQLATVSSEHAKWQTNSVDPTFQASFAQTEAAFRAKTDAAMTNATCHYHFP